MRDLEARFAEVEQRVKGLVTENRALARRVKELEGELAQTRAEAQELRLFHGKRAQLKEKLERVLSMLSALENSGAAGVEKEG